MLQPFGHHNAPAQIGQYGVNWDDIRRFAELTGQLAPHAADYALGRGDFAPIKRGSSQFMEADSSSNKKSNSGPSNDTDTNMEGITSGGSNIMGVSSGGSSSQGKLGKYKGNASTKSGWENYYFERDILHSRKILSRDLLWGFSSFTTQDLDGKGITLNKWGNCFGQVYRPEVKGNDARLSNIFNSFNTQGETYVSVSDNCYSHAINFSVGDFFDKKVLSEKGGALRNFAKVTLVKFAVKVQIITRRKSTVDWNNGMYHCAERANPGAAPAFSVHTNYESVQSTPPDTKYWIYRDKNGDYIDAAKLDIPNTPPDAADGALQDKLPRTCHQIRAYDNNLCVCSDSEPFYFEREISPNGPYYITPQKIWDIRQNNMAVLVNTIEHQYGSSNIISSLPEYYNLLIVPCNVDWYQSHLIRLGGTDADPTRGHLINSDIATQLAITCTATWKGFNYNHKGQMQVQAFNTVTTDPLDIAEMQFKASQTSISNKIDKNIL